MLFYNEKIFKRCFCWPKKQWYKNIKEIPLYFKLMNYLIKHGYDEYATWETFSWFINTMKPILIKYRDSHISYPARLSDSEWRSTLDWMIQLLDNMDEDNPKYDDMDHKVKYEKMNLAKDEFFLLFATFFYDLWD